MSSILYDDKKVYFRSIEEKHEKMKLILDTLGIDKDNKTRLLLAIYPELCDGDGTLDLSRNNKMYWSKHDRLFNEVLRNPFLSKAPIPFTRDEIDQFLQFLAEEKSITLTLNQLVNASYADLKVLLGWSFEDATALSKLNSKLLNNLGKLNIYSLSTSSFRMLNVGDTIDTADNPPVPTYKKGEQFTVGIDLPDTVSAGEYYSALFCAIPGGFAIYEEDKQYHGVLIVNEQDQHDHYQINPEDDRLILSPRLQAYFSGAQQLYFLMLKKPFIQFDNLASLDTAQKCYFLTRSDLYNLVECYSREVKRTSEASTFNFGAATVYYEVVDID